MALSPASLALKRIATRAGNCQSDWPLGVFRPKSNPHKMATELVSPHFVYDDDSTEALDVRITITMGKSLADRINDYRYGRRIPSESAAIRQLIIAGLKSEAWRSKKPS